MPASGNVRALLVPGPSHGGGPTPPGRKPRAAPGLTRSPLGCVRPPQTAPLVVMNGFSGDETLRLVTTMFQVQLTGAKGTVPQHACSPPGCPALVPKALCISVTARALLVSHTWHLTPSHIP
jgi:hypothetical protein